MLLGIFHNVWDWTAVGTLALAFVGAVALVVAWLTLRETKADLALSRKEVEEAHRPLVVPLNDRREVNLGSARGTDKLPAVPHTRQVSENGRVRSQLLVPIENIGTGPAIRLEAGIALDSNAESSSRSLPALRADGRLFLEFWLAGGDAASVTPSYRLTVRYEDVAGKARSTLAYFAAHDGRYDSLTAE
jgi:hypothetical protein